MLHMATYIARISPQVCSGNQDITIDPAGEATWDATVFIKANSPYGEDFGDLREAADKAAGEEVGDLNDVLAQDPAAPEWVKRHVQDHPFEIYVHRSDMNPEQVPMTYHVTVRRVEEITYEVAAFGIDEAEENMYGGDEVFSETMSTEVTNIELVN